VRWKDLEAARAALAARAGRKITQQQMASLLGVELSTMNCWRPSGKYGAPPSQAVACVRALMRTTDAGLAELLSGIDSRE
jgi:transcriptional regulator with XRE-family HTH domain